jgi:lipopolysaccharide/colanic/teichoic acid biosynthesis glycosyltransferase
MQRFFDFFMSLLALLLLSPLLIPLSIILLFSGEGEVFFRQNRVGKNGKVFGLFKFATMLKNSPNIGTGNITIKNDNRVLPLGVFLRKSKINELPQLVNILLGDMSIIGPRPLTQDIFENYPLVSQKVITSIRPGLSGISSIIFRGEENMLHQQADARKFYNEVILPYKGLLESWYISHQGLLDYFKLIGLTIWVVLFPTSKVVWSIYPSLPKPPIELQKYLVAKQIYQN